jgi:hypothetical protein
LRLAIFEIDLELEAKMPASVANAFRCGTSTLLHAR